MATRRMGSGCCAASFGLVFIAVGLLASPLLSLVLYEGVRMAVVWGPNSPPPVDDRYRNSDAVLSHGMSEPDTVRVWLWNITNVAEVRAGAKPIMAEVGPYVYYKSRLKLDVWFDRQGRVSIKEYNYFTPVAELTHADLNATIVTLNLPLIGVVEAVHASTEAIFHRLLDLIVRTMAGWHDPHVDGLFVRRNASELLWGYEDPLLQRLAALLPPGTLPTTRFQLLQNTSSADVARAAQPTILDTGATDLKNTMQVLEQNGLTSATVWGEGCEQAVQGTDGFQFAPGVTRGDTLRVWVAELFQSSTLKYHSDSEMYGVKMLRFRPNPADFEPNQCLQQYIRGLKNITAPMAVGPRGNLSLAHGVPVLPSLPHYCFGDPSLAAALEGVACDEAIHATYADVEPITGIAMGGAKRGQVSSQMTDEARRFIEPTINTSYILPIFWSEEACRITEKQGAMFVSTMYRTLAAKKYVGMSGLILGLMLLALAAFQALTAGVDTAEDAAGAAADAAPGGASSAGAAAAEETVDADVERQAPDGAPGSTEEDHATPLLAGRS